QAVVLAREDKQGNKRLVGYIVAEDVYDREAILSYVKDKLPDYMIPSLFMEMDKFPLTANGKIDRNALPDPDATEILSDQYIAPRNDVEAKLALLWQDVLEVEQVGMNDDFFELGGHSLLAVRLVSAIRKAFIVEMPISDIFDYPTVASLAAQLVNSTDNIVLAVIEPVMPRPERIPLSFSQERLWITDRLKGSIQYHIPAVLRLKGKLNKEALTYSLQHLVNRHEVLRTVILEEEGQPHQHIMDKNAWQLSVIDGSLYKEDQDGLQRYIQQLIIAPFDLSKDYMIRGHLITFDGEENVLVVTLHHIASDGWSKSILIKEVTEVYNSYEESMPANLQLLPIQYADYAIWQRNYLQGEVLDKKLGYWKEKLQELTPLDLPEDYSRPSVQSIRGASANFNINEILSLQLQDLSKQEGVTLFMTLLAAFKVLLHRYSGQQDICVGTPIAGRQQQGLEELIGFFLNTLALRTEVNRSASFKELLQKVRATTLEAYEHQEVPFEKIMETVIKKRDLSRSPLFQVMFELQNTPNVPKLHFGEVELSQKAFAPNTSKFDLTFSITERPSGLAGSVQYCTDLYNKETIIRMMDHFKELLDTIVKEPAQSIDVLLKRSDIKIFASGDLKVEDPSPVNPFEYFTEQSIEQTLVSRFEEQVRKHPDKVAVYYDDGMQISYRELNGLSNGLAQKILNLKGVENPGNIALLLEHGKAAVTGMLGVLKTGNAYVPLDPYYPVERLKYILADTNCDLIITSTNTAALAEKLGVGITTIKIINLDEDIFSYDSNLNLAIGNDSLAYILYTSGSTGEPKGVMQSHRNVLHFIRLYTNNLHISSDDRISLLPTYAFDSSVMDIYGALLNGASLYPYNLKQSGIDVLAAWLKVNNISIIHMVPTVYRNFILSLKEEVFDSIRLVVLGGETVYKKDFEDFKNHFKEGAIFINGYGPTESTITLQKFLNHNSIVDKWNIPIGSPVKYTDVHLLNDKDEEVAIYEMGEIIYKSDFLALGYWKKKEQTERVFTIDPKTKTGKVYRSGDLGRKRPGGEIEFLGRKDNQVKIHGQRIELSEIEQNLIKIQGVGKAVVIIRKLNNEDKLVAYVVSPANSNKKQNAIRQALRQRLPDYMIPSHIIFLNEFPLTLSGKIDKNALPDPDMSQLQGNEYAAPRNETEQRLANIWQGLLGVERIGIYDNFFELGGNSLKAISLIIKVNKELDTKLEVIDLFQNQVIGDLAKFIQIDYKIDLTGRSKIDKKAFYDHNSKKLAGNKYLIPIKTEGNKVPLYIVAGAGGTAYRFMEFAKMLDQAQPVYALQPPIDIKDIKEFPDTIEKIAGKFIEEIMTKNPEGPYALSGHCVGGIIAFEMAKQLEARGKKVHMLIMFDTIIRKREKRAPANFNNFYNIPLFVGRFISQAVLKFDFESYLLRKYTSKAIEYKMKSFQSLLKKTRKDTNPEDLEFVGLEIFNESSDLFKAASRKYKITPYDGKLILFYAKERYYFTDASNNIRFKKIRLNDSTKNTWRQYANSVSILEVDGDHSDMFETTYAHGFAQLLQQYLNTNSN
ncbi:MAG: amino acid adenylation domain-containing protein, partial [Ginsengibacter sp.]